MSNSKRNDMLQKYKDTINELQENLQLNSQDDIDDIITDLQKLRNEISEQDMQERADCLEKEIDNLRTYKFVESIEELDINEEDFKSEDDYYEEANKRMLEENQDIEDEIRDILTSLLF